MSVLKINWNDLIVNEHYIYEYNGLPFTGNAYDYDTCNKVIAETQFVGGVKQGIETEWNANGQILSVFGFHCNRPHGKCIEYSQNGIILLDSEYEFGICIFENKYSADGSFLDKYNIETDQDALSDLQAARKVFLS